MAEDKEVHDLAQKLRTLDLAAFLLGDETLLDTESLVKISQTAGVDHIAPPDQLRQALLAHLSSPSVIITAVSGDESCAAIKAATAIVSFAEGARLEVLEEPRPLFDDNNNDDEDGSGAVEELPLSQEDEELQERILGLTQTDNESLSERISKLSKGVVSVEIPEAPPMPPDTPSRRPNRIEKLNGMNYGVDRKTGYVLCLSNSNIGGGPALEDGGCLQRAYMSSDTQSLHNTNPAYVSVPANFVLWPMTFERKNAMGMSAATSLWALRAKDMSPSVGSGCVLSATMRELRLLDLTKPLFVYYATELFLHVLRRLVGGGSVAPMAEAHEGERATALRRLGFLDDSSSADSRSRRTLTAILLLNRSPQVQMDPSSEDIVAEVAPYLLHAMNEALPPPKRLDGVVVTIGRPSYGTPGVSAVALSDETAQSALKQLDSDEDKKDGAFRGCQTARQFVEKSIVRLGLDGVVAPGGIVGGEEEARDANQGYCQQLTCAQLLSLSVPRQPKAASVLRLPKAIALYSRASMARDARLVSKPFWLSESDMEETQGEPTGDADRDFYMITKNHLHLLDLRRDTKSHPTAAIQTLAGMLRMQNPAAVEDRLLDEARRLLDALEQGTTMETSDAVTRATVLMAELNAEIGRTYGSEAPLCDGWVVENKAPDAVPTIFLLDGIGVGWVVKFWLSAQPSSNALIAPSVGTSSLRLP